MLSVRIRTTRMSKDPKPMYEGDSMVVEEKEFSNKIHSRVPINTKMVRMLIRKKKSTRVPQNQEKARYSLKTTLKTKWNSNQTPFRALRTEMSPNMNKRNQIALFKSKI